MKNESLNGDAPVPLTKRANWERAGVRWAWWYCEKYPTMSDYSYYFYWWNRLHKKDGNRYVGFQTMYYDGYHYSFGFWFINWTWNVEIPFLSTWMRKQYDKPEN